MLARRLQQYYHYFCCYYYYINNNFKYDVLIIKAFLMFIILSLGSEELFLGKDSVGVTAAGAPRCFRFPGDSCLTSSEKKCREESSTYLSSVWNSYEL